MTQAPSLQPYPPARPAEADTGSLRQSWLHFGDRNHNHDLKNLFESAAITASTSDGALGEFYENLLKKGMRAEMARLTLARKIAAITLHFPRPAPWRRHCRT